jgi:putative FmdB family regulatory protein
MVGCARGSQLALRRWRFACSHPYLCLAPKTAMPIYAYKCESCGHAKDVLQKLSDAPLTDCPACGAPTFAKQVTAAGFQLKGSGWYVTDFRNGSGKAATPAGTPATTAAESAGAGSGTSADTGTGTQASTTESSGAAATPATPAAPAAST